MENNRKKEVINICLDHFISHGLETSTRSLSKALKLQNAGLYYYFESKDEAVILCAEAAALRLETNLIVEVNATVSIRTTFFDVPVTSGVDANGDPTYELDFSKIGSGRQQIDYVGVLGY